MVVAAVVQFQSELHPTGLDGRDRGGWGANCAGETEWRGGEEEAGSFGGSEIVRKVGEQPHFTEVAAELPFCKSVMRVALGAT